MNKHQKPKKKERKRRVAQSHSPLFYCRRKFELGLTGVSCMPSEMRSLYELYSITYWDLVMDNGRDLRRYSEKERAIRRRLREIADQHFCWREEAPPRLRHYGADDGDPNHASRESWEAYAKKYRADWWLKKFGSEFNPMCACESAEFCSCIPFLRGLVYIDGRTEIEGALSKELREMYYPIKTVKPAPPPPGYYSCPGCNVFLVESFSKCPLCQTLKA